MSNTRIPSPARSQGPSYTSRKYKPRPSRSVCSPAHSNASGRLTSVITQFKESNLNSFVLSPLNTQSILSDNTYIENPGRQSWWKKINENSRCVMELLDNNKMDQHINNVSKFDEYIDVEILSKEKNNLILDLPELSDNESIKSIHLPQRKLFSHKDIRVQNNFDQLGIQRESLGSNKTNPDIIDVNIAPKKLLNRCIKPSKPAFPTDLLNLSPNKTVANKTKEFLLKTQAEFQVRTLFGNRAATKRKKTFADFIVSESEDDIRSNTNSRGTREYSPTSSIATDIEPDEWNLLPSSTMVDKQLEHIVVDTPVKKTRLRKLSETKESDNRSKSNSTVNKSKHSNRSTRSNKNTSKQLSKSNIEKGQDDISESRKAGPKQIDGSRVQNNSETVATEHNSDNDENFVLQYVHDEEQISEPKQMNREDEILTSKNKELSLKVENVSRNLSKTFNKTTTEQEIDNDHNEEIEQYLEKEVDDKKQAIENDEQNFNEEMGDDKQEIDNIDNEDNGQDLDQEINDDEEQAIENERNVDEEMEGDAQESDDGQNEEDEQNVEQEIDDQEEQDIDNYEQNIDEGEEQEFDNDQNNEDEHDLEQEINDDEKKEIKKDERNVNIEKDGIEQEIDNDQNEDDKQDLEQEIHDDDKPEIEDNESNMEQETEGGEQNGDDDIESDEQEGEDDEQDVENEMEDDEENLEHEVESDNEVVAEEQDSEDSEEIDQDQSQDIELNESNEQNDEEEMSQHGADNDGNDADDIDDASNKSQDEIESSDQELQGNDSRRDNTGRNREEILSPETVLHNHKSNVDSFTAQGRNTSVRKTKSMINRFSITAPGLVSERDSTRYSDGTKNSSAERSGWDSHGTTRKTLRQTFGKDFTPRKSLRTLVMEKSAKRRTALLAANQKTNSPKLTSNEENEDITNFPRANSTELPEISNNVEEDEEFEESDHEASRIRRRTAFEEVMEKIQRDNMKIRLTVEEKVRNSLKNTAKVNRDNFIFKVPSKPAPRNIIKPQKRSSKPKELPNGLPKEFLDDMKYKPPKRFQPRNAPWITNRLYKFLENKLEPRYNYKARVRAEKLVEALYEFTTVVRRRSHSASQYTVDTLKQEMARLNIVTTHADFYQFFHEFMPREIRVMVNPDIVNNIPMPREGVFSNILQSDTSQC